jgi:VWFA-related protein
MRKLVLLALVGVLATTAEAARRTSVAQLEETLAAATAEHRPDADIARQISGMELSERLTAATLDRLAARLPLQPRTALALQLLSDQSAFLDPPSTELPATAPPDAAEQRRMLEAARGWVVTTVPSLPNFFATRTTNRFDDSPQVIKQGDWPVRAGLHPVGSTYRKVTFRDGKEVADASVLKARAAAQELGLHTWGEFGPELSVVLTDLVNGSSSFHHWEQLPTGLIAVYHYSVPPAASHYAVHYCCTINTPNSAAVYSPRGRTAVTSNYSSEPTIQNAVQFNATPGYHGEISIDPATGAVMRITLEAELKPGDPISHAATVVEYGPVSIGDRAFVCPVRSLAISVEEAGSSTVAGAVATNGGSWPTLKTGSSRGPLLLVNETAFTDYHRLGSTTRIVADAPAPADQPQPPPNLANLPPYPSSSSSAAVPTPPSEPPSPAIGEAPQPAATAPSAPPATAAAPPAPPPTPVIPEISMGEAQSIPDIPTGATGAAQADTGFSLKVTTRLVDIGLVATDKKGHAVTDLKTEDFEIYDGKVKRDIRFFTAPPAPPQAESQSQSQPPAKPARSALPAEPEQRDYSNRAPEPVAATAKAAEQAAGTILLVDESHIAWADMQNARNHMLKFLDTLPSGERVGLYTMNGLGFRVLVEVTSDHGALIGRLKKFMPTAQSLQQAQEEETRNRQAFDYVHNAADLNSVNGNHSDVPDAEQPIDPQLLTMGSNPARASLIILAQVARHLASIPGHKNLVWVSSDNVLAEWQDQQVGIDKSPKSNETFALRAQEVMNEAHAAVYPFDVSQLEAGGVGADLQHANVQLTPAQQENMATAAAAGGGGGANLGSSRDTGTGRITAAMSQDLHPIQGTVRDLASGTGGRPIRRSGDLAAQLSGIVEDGHATYQLSFSPEGPADDQYHKLTVKLVGHHGVTIRYRAGYLYAKEPATLKDRFREAIWRPTDISEIGVDAKVAPSGSGFSIKLNIAAADLGMEQAGGRWMDKLDIFFIQRDDAGIHAQLEGQTLGLRLKPTTYQNVLASGVPFERAVEMHPGLASLRVLVVDENSGRMGSITLPARELHGPMQAKSF